LGTLADASRNAVALESATGVEIHLPIAGPGARAYAYLVDWHVRVVLFCAWYVSAALLHNRQLSLSPPLDPGGSWFGLVVAPAAALYFLYHFVLEIGMRGRTPGKRMAGVRVVAHDGGPPTAGALIVRNVFRLIDSFPVFYGVGLIATMLTRNRVRIGDVAAGTLLVYDRPDAAFLANVSDAAFARRLGPGELEVMSDLLQRWHELAVDVRGRMARELIGRGGTAVEPSTGDAALRALLEHIARGESR
jgi:uncharacterized RDD family membrane protein YckC